MSSHRGGRREPEEKMTKRRGLVLGTVLALASAGLAVPIVGYAFAENDDAQGSIVIPLTTEAGDLTTTATAQIDEEAESKPGSSKEAEPREAAHPTEASHPTGEAEPAQEASAGRAGGVVPNAVRTNVLRAVGTENKSAENGAEDSADGAELADNYAVFTSPVRVDEPFAVAGLTWNRGESLPEGASIEMRTLDGEQWSDWYEVGEESQTERERPGTEYNVSGESTGIQVRITQGEGPLPAGLRIDIAYTAEGDTVEVEETETAPILPERGTETDPVVNPEEGEEEIPALGASLSAARGGGTLEQGSVVANGLLPTARDWTNRIGTRGIHTRADWGADGSLMTWPVEYATFQGMVIHHTAGSNNYTQAGVPRVIRGIYAFHAVTRDWGDIGYNVIVDKYGGKWEGRYGTLQSQDGTMAIGAHAAGRNTGTMGVSVLGTFTANHRPSQTILNTLADVAGWKFALAGLDPRGTTSLTIPQRNNSARYRSGEAMPRIVGHRDVGNTSCPGTIYDSIGSIRENAYRIYTQLRSGGGTTTQPAPRPTQPPAPRPPAPPAPAPSNPRPSSTVAPFPPRFFLANGWGRTADIVMDYGLRGDEILTGDWNGDGRDTLAIRRSNIFHVRDTLTSGVATRVFSFGRADDEVFVGDWDGDGVDTFAVRRGNLLLVRNSLTSGPADTVYCFGNPGDTWLVGDWNGDGVDTLAVRRGNVFIFTDNLATSAVSGEMAYGNPGDEVLAAKIEPQRSTLVVRRGNVYVVRGPLSGPEVTEDVTYGRHSDMVIFGDWDGRGGQTLGVVRSR
ncbi:N-acetylmuramoyl-L-alanine amidase [Actinotignum timonense]|uniref:N-acetylmuramoyl-L-alanine amidase n=1 Tax=Actinotignum timonense TaxID=1870995 RepID=UPI002A83B0C6|nr:N-acetylmuramoyl-L-alanine amidase [Actinotignum timonense]MDY5143974.1 N-acetylmuramoyl-L-alanine amidase [Actinotignum timonense]